MLTLAQQNLPPDDISRAHGMILFIAVVGGMGIVLLLIIFLLRRMTRRWKQQIERDIEKRREERTPTTDVWSIAAQRYVDPDLLSPEELAARQTDTDDSADEEPPPFDDDEEEAPGEEGPDEPMFADPSPEDEDDPYGLFRDKPYVDPDDEDDFDEDDEDGDGFEDEDELDKP